MATFTEFPHYLMEDFIKSMLFDKEYVDIPLSIKSLLASNSFAFFTDWYFVTDFTEEVVATITTNNSVGINLINKNISSIVLKNSNDIILQNGVHYEMDSDGMRNGSLYINSVNIQMNMKNLDDPIVNPGETVYITYSYMLQKDSCNGIITDETYITIFDGTNNFQWNLYELLGSSTGRGFSGDGFYVVGAQKTIIGDGGKSFIIYALDNNGRYIPYKVYPDETFDDNRSMFFFQDLVVASMTIDPVDIGDVGLDGTPAQPVDDEYAFIYETFMDKDLIAQKSIIIDQNIIISPNIIVIYKTDLLFTPICPIEYTREDFDISFVDSLDRIYTSTISIIDGFIYEHDFIETDNFTIEFDVIDGLLCVKLSRDAKIIYNRISYNLNPIVLPNNDLYQNTVSVITGALTLFDTIKISGVDYTEDRILLSQVDTTVYNRQDLSCVSTINGIEFLMNATCIFNTDLEYTSYCSSELFDIYVEKVGDIANIYITHNSTIVEYNVVALNRNFKILPDLVDVDILDGDLFQYDSILISTTDNNIIDEFDIIQYKKAEYSIIVEFDDIVDTLTYTCDLDIVSNGIDIFFIQDNIMGDLDNFDITISIDQNMLTVGYTSDNPISRIYICKKYYNNIFFSTSIGKVSTQKEVVYGINSEIQTNIDIFNGTNVYFRKDSGFHHWLKDIAGSYYLTTSNIDIKVDEYLNMEKDFIYFGRVYKRSDGKILITFEGIKDYVIKLLPVHMRTLGMKEFLYCFYDKEYSRIYDSLKNIWSLIDPKECDVYMLEKIISYYGLDHVFESYDNKRILSEYVIDVLKTKGTYKSLHIIYDILTKSSKNVIKFYDSWCNFTTDDMAESDIFYIDIASELQPYYSKIQDSFIYNSQKVVQATRYNVDISISTMPFDDLTIISKTLVKDMIWCFDEVRPINRIANYSIIFDPTYYTTFERTSQYDLTAIVNSRDSLYFKFGPTNLVNVESGSYTYEIVHNLGINGLISTLYDSFGLVVSEFGQDNMVQYIVSIIDNNTIRYTILNNDITSVSIMISTSTQSSVIDSIVNAVNKNIYNNIVGNVYNIVEKKYEIDGITPSKQFLDSVSNDNCLYSYILDNGDIIDEGDITSCPILTFENGDMYINFDVSYTKSKILNVLMKKDVFEILENKNYTYGYYPVIRSTYNGVLDYTDLVVTAYTASDIINISKGSTKVVLSQSDAFVEVFDQTFSMQTTSARIFSIYEAILVGDDVVISLLNPSNYTIKYIDGEYIFEFSYLAYRVVSYIDIGTISSTSIVPTYYNELGILSVSPDVSARVFYNENNSSSGMILPMIKSLVVDSSRIEYENNIPYIYEYTKYICEFSKKVDVVSGITINKFEVIDGNQNIICYSDVYSELFIDYNMNIKYNINII